MSIFRLESQLLPRVGNHLRRSGFRRQMAEVPFFDFSMDIFGYDQSSDLSIAVELKLSRWVRALEQALIYQLCADLAFIALPVHRTKAVDLDLLRRYGVGLIGVNQTRGCEIIVDAVPNGVVIASYRSFYVALARGEAV